MSEFSYSLHLRTADPSAAEALLRRAGVRGAILLPIEGPFVAFLVDPESEGAVAANNSGLLIRYEFAEDYGCWIRVYDGPNKMAELAYENEGVKEDTPEDVYIEERQDRQDRNAALDALVHVGLIDGVARITLSTLDAQGHSSEWGPAVAEILQLRPVEWLDGRDLEHPQQLFDAYPATRLVGMPPESAQ
jgi:hypothetical protein